MRRSIKNTPNNRISGILWADANEDGIYDMAWLATGAAYRRRRKETYSQ